MPFRERNSAIEESVRTVIGLLWAVAATGFYSGWPGWIAAPAKPADALQSGARTTAAGVSLMQRSLVILQAALSLVLLVGAGLFSQSLSRLQSTDLKLETKNRYIVHINPQAAGYKQTQLEALYRTMGERFHALPGVMKVGIATYTAMEDNNWSNDIQVQGQPNLIIGASLVKANAEYFESVGTHLVMGRGIGVQDTSTAPPVAMVNRSCKSVLWKSQSDRSAHWPLCPNSSEAFEIVGVVEDTAYTTVRWKDHSMFFVPIMQRPVHTDEPIEDDLSLYAGAIVLQTQRPMNEMEELAQRTLAGINPNLTVVKFQTFDQQIADRFNEERMTARLTMLFGALALLLATIGLYGVTAYTVARRAPEIGIRMALGADRGGVITMVMRGAIIQTVLGLTIGVPVALLCVRFVKAQLYEITSADTAVMAGAIVTLAAAACVAGIIPARARMHEPVKL